jgi:hypothetical protein
MPQKFFSSSSKSHHPKKLIRLSHNKKKSAVKYSILPTISTCEDKYDKNQFIVCLPEAEAKRYKKTFG